MQIESALLSDIESPRDYKVAAVEHALNLLEALARLGPSTLASLADAVGCTRSLAFRMLRTLEQRGFTLQDGARGAWRLGARNSALGREADGQGALARVAQPVLVSLSKICGENAYLMIRDGTLSRILNLHRADPKYWEHDVIGQTRQLHAGPGRLLLAHAPVAVQKRVLSERLGRLAPQTRTDPIAIAADLHRVRARGVLVTVGEVKEGGIAVAAPVRDLTGEVMAVLFISTSVLRLAPTRAQTRVPTVLAHADRLSRGLGYKSPG